MKYLTRIKQVLFSSLLFILISCGNNKFNLRDLLSSMESIEGKKAFSATSYITAGDRLYAVGSQDGGFPEIGWHINKEMGGVWNHPIKLLDGFALSIEKDSEVYPLTDATFTNYPMASAFFYSLNQLGLNVEQLQFSPDGYAGLIVDYTIINNNNSAFNGTLQFDAMVDLRPTWLSERQNIEDGLDSLFFLKTDNLMVAKDSKNEWYCAVSSTEPIQSFRTDTNQYQGKGQTGELTCSLSLDANSQKTIRFFIVGSYKSDQELTQTINHISTHTEELFQKKIKRVDDIAKHSKLTTSDPKFDEVYRWIKYNSEWFVREVPEFGRGIAAGYPDYPWWFGCDSEYALQGYLSVGQFPTVKSTIRLLSKLSKETNTNGRIIHEASTNGVVYNPGNINETPQFVSLLWNAYLWTGDKDILIENFDLVQKGLTWISNTQDLDQNGFPEGSGMMEIHGLNTEMIDVASYAQRAFEDAGNIANELGKMQLADNYRTKAKDLKDKINDRFWVDDFNSFADFIAKDQQTLQLIDDAIVRAKKLNKPWAVQELLQTKEYVLKNPSKYVRPFVLHHNWVVNTPMELGIADPKKAKKALQTARKFVNPFGVFVTGIDRDERAEEDTESFKGSKVFSYVGAVMTLPTGVLAVAENTYGNADQALNYLKRMGRSFSFALPGSIYEVSPDYGMFAQAWNIYSYTVPVVQQFFGIKPFASKRQITISPLMPSEWKHAKLENVIVGQNQISIHYNKTDANGYLLTIQSEQNDWDITCLPPKDYQIIATQKIDKNTTSYEVVKKIKNG